MLMNRQIGANLAAQNAIVDENQNNGSTFRIHPSREFIEKATLKTWREGVTGKIQFSIKINTIGEEKNDDDEKGCTDDYDEINTAKKSNDKLVFREDRFVDEEKGCTRDFADTKIDTPKETNDNDLILLQPPTKQNNLPVIKDSSTSTFICPPLPISVGSMANQIPSVVNKTSPTAGTCAIETLSGDHSLPSDPISHDAQHTNLINDVLKTREKKTRKTLFLEIERCIDLRQSIRNCIRFTSRKVMCPFVVIRLDGKEVGRTPAMRFTENPVWMDQCFEFPICHLCSWLCLEIWSIIPNNHGSHFSGGENKLGDYIGQASISISSIIGFSKEEGMKEYTEELRRLKPQNDDVSREQNLCSCPDKMQPKTPVPHRETIRIKPPNRTYSLKRRRSLIKEKPDMDRGIFVSEKYKVNNPYPFRRKDIRETSQQKKKESFFSSTSFKAITLVVSYLSLGIFGYSYMFEHWPIKDSLYFSVVTFTTVGYGDLKPQTDGGKLFCCIFALSGIGIIGIALGYIGQNLVQAQVMALERTQRRLSSKEKKGQMVTENEVIISKWMQNLIRNIFIFICPIAAMIVFGSMVVGYNEGWNWVDSLYWCVITGTSVGFGDFTPKKESMKWFSIVFIPLSVGIISASLGRIANIFVEKEIAKANTKLLNREVTLEDLEAMNADGDGEVSPLEFVEYMLKTMHKVDQTLLDQLHKQFEHLDADGSGGLQQDDLELLTERKLSERRHQAIERYRRGLLVRRRNSIKSFRTSKIIPNG